MEDRVEIFILCDVVILKLDVNKLEKSLLGWHFKLVLCHLCLLYTSPSPRDKRQSRMPSSA